MKFFSNTLFTYKPNMDKCFDNVDSSKGIYTFTGEVDDDKDKQILLTLVNFVMPPVVYISCKNGNDFFEHKIVEPTQDDTERIIL